MIHTDGRPTTANRPPTDEDWRKRIERDLMTLDRAERERVYRACKENTTNVFDWLACLDDASGS